MMMICTYQSELIFELYLCIDLMIDLIYYILSFMGTHFHSLTNQFLIIKLIFHET